MLNLSLRRGPRVKVVVLPAVSFQPVPTEAASGLSVFGRDKSSSVCFERRNDKHQIHRCACRP